MTRLVGLLLQEVVLTRDEVVELMAGLRICSETPTGTTGLRTWLESNADGVGRRYVSERQRNCGR